MGDFDRKQEKSGPKDQSKQILVVAVLGVVLMGVLGYHFMGRGPKPAVAAPGIGGIPIPVVDETAEQASNALREDPTAALLRQNTAADPSFDRVPRNPFLISDGWKTTLVLPVEPTVAVVTPTVVTPRTTAVRAIPTPKAESFKLGSTIRQGGDYLAIINGRVVSKGAVIGDVRIVDIQEGRAVLQHADHPEGPRVELTMEPKLK